jgi:hypothetical protein
MIPKGWKDISIRKFIRVNEVVHTEYEQPLDQQIALIAAVTDMPEAEILRLERTELQEMVEALSFLNSVDSISTKWPKWFMIRGRLFKPVQKLDKLTAGQYIDLMSFAKEPMENLHKVLATLSLPCKWFRAQKYDGSRHKELSDFFYEHLTMDIAYPIALFFCNLWQAFMPTILTFLEKEVDSLTTSMNQEIAEMKHRNQTLS